MISCFLYAICKLFACALNGAHMSIIACIALIVALPYVRMCTCNTRVVMCWLTSHAAFCVCTLSFTNCSLVKADIAIVQLHDKLGVLKEKIDALLYQQHSRYIIHYQPI